MKKILLLLTCLTAFTASYAQTINFATAIEYNDYIVDKQLEIGNLIKRINAVIDDTTKTKSDAHDAREAAVVKSRSCIEDIQKMPAWKGNTELRDAAATLFGLYASCFENEYSKMINIIYKPVMSDEDKAELDRMMSSITERENVLDKRFNKAQEDFAKANGFTLTPPGDGN